jgi:hypothetical protein
MRQPRLEQFNSITGDRDGVPPPSFHSHPTPLFQPYSRAFYALARAARWAAVTELFIHRRQNCAALSHFKRQGKNP